MSICELCWAPFENDEELAKHVEMEEAVGWPIGGLTPDDDAHWMNARRAVKALSDAGFDIVKRIHGPESAPSTSPV